MSSTVEHTRSFGYHLHCDSSVSTESRSRLAWLCFKILTPSLLLLLLVLNRWLLEPTYNTDNAKRMNPALTAAKSTRHLPRRWLGLDFITLLSELLLMGMLGDSSGVGVVRRMVVMIRSKVKMLECFSSAFFAYGTVCSNGRHVGISSTLPVFEILSERGYVC